MKQYFSTQSKAEELVVGRELRCLDRDTGIAERYSKVGAPAILPMREALIEVARNCGAAYVYVFDEGAWSCKELQPFPHFS